MKKSLAIVLSTICLSGTLMAQGTNTDPINEERFECDDKSGECSIQGTSTLHDWESRIEDFSIKAVRNGDLIDAEFNVVVESIKSGHNGMDKNTYVALKEEQHPNIKFKAKGLMIENNSKIKGYGNLTIAGTTKRIPVEFSMTSWVKDTMTITGEIKIKMTEFGVDPPVALFGTVKTGDEIVFVIDSTLNRTNN